MPTFSNVTKIRSVSASDIVNAVFRPIGLQPTEIKPQLNALLGSKARANPQISHRIFSIIGGVRRQGVGVHNAILDAANAKPGIDAEPLCIFNRAVI